jgi:O-6-methylguanine DNA methyltransferase
VNSVEKFKALEVYVTHHLNNGMQVNLFQEPVVPVTLSPFIINTKGYDKAHFKSLVFNKTVPTSYLNALLSSENQSSVLKLYELKVENTIQNEIIEYAYVETDFGEAIMAQTSFGLCFFDLYNSENQGLMKLKERFAKNEFKEVASTVFEKVKQNTRGAKENIKLHLQGTDFQINVWKWLLLVPLGNVVTYLQIAESIADEKSSRAVGAAVGQNPIALLIPCHRVVHSNGGIGHYMWGQNKKVALLVHELLLSK